MIKEICRGKMKMRGKFSKLNRSGSIIIQAKELPVSCQHMKNGCIIQHKLILSKTLYQLCQDLKTFS